MWLLAYYYGQHLTLVCTWMGDRSGMSISADSPLDETLNRGPPSAALVTTL